MIAVYLSLNNVTFYNVKCYLFGLYLVTPMSGKVFLEHLTLFNSFFTQWCSWNLLVLKQRSVYLTLARPSAMEFLKNKVKCFLSTCVNLVREHVLVL